MKKVKTYNFSNPLHGRKWLRLLYNDPVSGFRIQPNLDLPTRALGFSFRSNALGLRGPAEVNAPNVVLGTSFAMGFAVDNGLNWYERSLEGDWLNLGLPVGARQIENMVQELYRGPAHLALMLYHPNLWAQTRVLEACNLNGLTAFQAMHWQVDFIPCLELALRRLRWRSHDIRSGKLLFFQHQGRKYEMTSLYNNFDFKGNPEITTLVLDAMERILARFIRVIVIRTRLKQELVPKEYHNDLLRSTLNNYEEGWELFKGRLGNHADIAFHVTEGFALEDFFPQDNHWSPQGNEKFAGLIRKVLQEDRTNKESQ